MLIAGQFVTHYSQPIWLSLWEAAATAQCRVAISSVTGLWAFYG